MDRIRAIGAHGGPRIVASHDNDANIICVGIQRVAALNQPGIGPFVSGV